MVLLVLGVISYPGLAMEQTDIGSELRLWLSSGKDLSQVSQCHLTSESNTSDLFYYADESCITPQLSAHILLNECPDYKSEINVTVLGKKSGRAVKTFVLDASICDALDTYMSQPKRHPIPKQMAKEYAIQFFSGKRQPETNQLPCVDIPLFVLKEKDTFYVVSQTFPTRKEAQSVLQRMQNRCERNIDSWIRPVYLN